ncbi:MAG: proton-conducting transporter membrane subunit [Candidatus Promineifilaceae bacterium]
MAPIPPLLVFGPVLLAIAALGLRRWPAGPALAGLGGLGALMAVLLAAGPSGAWAGASDWQIFGRALALGEAARRALLLVYAGLAMLLLLALVYRQNRSYVPLALLVLSPLAGALLIEPFLLGAVLLMTAGCGLAFLIQGERAGSTLAAMRVLALSVVAMTFLLAAGWLSSSGQGASPAVVARFYLLAFVILLASFPFQLWVAPAVTESGSLAPAVVFGLAQFLVLLFCLGQLAAAPAVQRSAEVASLLRWSGLLTVIAGALLALSARSFGRLLAYALLLDIGLTVVALSFGRPAGFEASLSLVAFRFVGLTLAGAGLYLIRRLARPAPAGSDQFAANAGLARRAPLAVALYGYGSLALVGAPLTPGFLARWDVIGLVAEASSWQAGLLVVLTAAGLLALGRRLASLLAARTDNDLAERASRGERLAALVALTLAALLAMAPDLLSGLIRPLPGLL